MIEVRLGRWQETLIGAYDPERAVVITDPPYGLDVAGGMGFRAPGSHGGTETRARELNRIDKGYADGIPWAAHVAEVLEKLPAKRHVIRGPATALIRRDYPAPRRLCIEIAPFRRRAAVRPGLVPYLWQGMVVIDPFAGHGTIGRAAQLFGLDYLGAEIDEVYARAAIASLEIERPTLGLAVDQ